MIDVRGLHYEGEASSTCTLILFRRKCQSNHSTLHAFDVAFDIPFGSASKFSRDEMPSWRAWMADTFPCALCSQSVILERLSIRGVVTSIVCKSGSWLASAMHMGFLMCGAFTSLQRNAALLPSQQSTAAACSINKSISISSAFYYNFSQTIARIFLAGCN